MPNGALSRRRLLPSFGLLAIAVFGVAFALTSSSQPDGADQVDPIASADRPGLTEPPDPPAAPSAPASPATSDASARPAAAEPGTPVTPPACDALVAVGQDLQAAADDAGDGATVCLAAGVHREAMLVPLPGQRVLGLPGAVMSGARDMTAADWTSQLLHPADRLPLLAHWTDLPQLAAIRDTHGEILPGGNPLHAYPHELFVDDVTRLAQVGSLNELNGANQWWFDVEQDRLWTTVDPAKVASLELSTTPFAIGPDPDTGRFPDDVEVANLVVEKYANAAQVAAVGGPADVDADGDTNDRWVIRRVESRLNHGCGIRVANGGRVEGNVSAHNGQIGVCGTAFEVANRLDMTIIDNEIHDNLELDFDPDWEGGGMKIVEIDGVLIANNWVHDNRGYGIWVDGEASNGVIRSNLAEGNERTGIFYEISYDGLIQWNVARYNGPAEDPEAGDMGAGIEVSESEGVRVLENVVDANRWGIFTHEGSRPHELADYRAEGNLVRSWRAEQWVHQVDAPAAAGLEVDDNVYGVGDPDEPLWVRRGTGGDLTAVDLAGWRLVSAAPFDEEVRTTDRTVAPVLPDGATPFSHRATGPVPCPSPGVVVLPGDDPLATVGATPDGGTVCVAENGSSGLAETATTLDAETANALDAESEGTVRVLAEAEGVCAFRALASGGVVLRPGDDLQAAVDATPSGGTVCVTSGIHYATSATPTAPVTLVGEEGAILSGATPLRRTDATADGSRLTWPLPEGDPTRATLWVDDDRWDRVDDPGDVDAPGEWAIDANASLVVLPEGVPANASVEVATVPVALDASATDGVTVDNVVVQRYANDPGTAAIGGASTSLGSGWTITRTEVRQTTGCGVGVGPEALLTHVHAHHNDGAGLCGGPAPGLESAAAPTTGGEVSRSRTTHNGAEGLSLVNVAGVRVSRLWSHDNVGAGVAVQASDDVLVEGLLTEHNGGPGFSFDGPVRVVDPVARDNADADIAARAPVAAYRPAASGPRHLTTVLVR